MRITSFWGLAALHASPCSYSDGYSLYSFLVSLSVLFDGAGVVVLNLMNGHGTEEDEFDSTYLDKDNGAIHFESCAASYEASEIEFA